jgi:hypothetical protein
MAARATPPLPPPCELNVVMYIIYTNLIPKQQGIFNTTSSSLNKIAVPPMNNTRIANSLKNNSNNNLMRDRATTLLLPSIKPSPVTPVRSSSVNTEQNTANNIPIERNVECFR